MPTDVCVRAAASGEVTYRSGVLQAAREERTSTEVTGDRRRFWRATRWVLGGLYLAAIVVFVATQGVPLDRGGITLWIFLGLTIVVLGKGWRAWVWMILDWLPFTLVMFAYDYSYGLLGHYPGGVMVEGSHNALGFPLHVQAPITFDTTLFGGVLPNAWMQQHLYVAGQSHWYDGAALLVYISHFIATPLIAMVLWITNRRRFRQWVAVIVPLAVVGIVTYMVYPMAPPWMAYEQGALAEPVHRITGLGWGQLGLGVAERVFHDGQALVNPVAAMPSLHMGFATMVALFFMLGAPWWRKVLLALYPLAMGTTLVYCGEHYVVDLLVGALYSSVIIAVWRAVVRRRRRQEGTRSEEAAEDSLPADAVTGG